MGQTGHVFLSSITPRRMMKLFWRPIRVLWASSFIGIERSRYVNQRDLARLPIQHLRHYSAVLVAAPHFPYLAMGKRRYREWTPTEEARLLHWMVLHPDSEWSWDTRAEKYSKTIRPRTAESLRSKLRQLRKNIRRHRPVHRRQARIAQGMTAKQARKEQQRTRDALPLTTTGVPLYRTHTKFRDIGAGPEEVERGGQAVPTAELSGSSPMNQVGKRPVRGKALVRSVQGEMDTFQAATVSILI